MTNIITACFGGTRYTNTRPAWLIDHGMVLQIKGVELPDVYEVDFSNSKAETATRVIGGPDGVVIPDQYFLSNAKQIYAWVYLTTGDSGFTTLQITIPLSQRPDVTDEPPTPQETDLIEQAIAALNDGVERAETAADDAEAAVANVQQTVNDALQAAKASGEFDGEDGANGVTYTPTVDAEGNISWVNDGGLPNPQTRNIKGPAGTEGEDGFSPTITVTDIEGGHRVTITDADGPHSFDVMDGSDVGAVDDVQVNGTSVVTSGVANVPLADSSTFGVVKLNGNYGLQKNSSNLATINRASDSDVKSGSNNYKPITPSNQNKATFYGLAKAAGDSTQASSNNAVGTYTETAKSKISEMLDAPEAVNGSTPTIAAKSGVRYICGEVSTLDITLSTSGIVDVVFTSGSTATVLTITPPTGVTLKWANGFDPTTLEANTTYELNISDGLGVALSWT